MIRALFINEYAKIFYCCFTLGFMPDYSPLFPNYSLLFWNNSRIPSNVKFPKLILDNSLRPNHNFCYIIIITVTIYYYNANQDSR